MKDWKKEFDKQFPYKGIIIEDNGNSYSFIDIKQFIAKLIKKARAEEREKACKIVKQFIDSILENNEGSLEDLLKKLKEL